METSELAMLGALSLNRVFGYYPKIEHSLIREIGSIEAIFSLSEQQRDEFIGPFSRFRGCLSDSLLDESRRERDRLLSQGYQITYYGEDCYPELLAQTEDPPLALYIRSVSDKTELFNGRAMVSIVGTRDISTYGREWTRRTVFTLSGAPTRPVIVSGLAYGVDICSHLTALEAGLSTIAVMPTGIEDVYPNGNRRAAEKIASTPGSALITDFPPGTEAMAATFLRRNRIIAGLSPTTLVMESKKKGGSLITAHTAFGYGREVYALPGRLDDVRSQGCNNLIREKVAEPISDLDLLPELIGLGHFNRRQRASLEEEISQRFSGRSDENEIKLLCSIAALIKSNRGICIDDIASQMGIARTAAVWIVGLLESEGFIATDLLQRCSLIIRNA